MDILGDEIITARPSGGFYQEEETDDQRDVFHRNWANKKQISILNMWMITGIEILIITSKLIKKDKIAYLLIWWV